MTETDQRVGTALFGCGYIGHSHAAALAAIPEFRLIAVADVDETRAKTFARRYGACQYATNTDDILRRDDVDVVIVATANNMHAPLTIAALEAGKHVLVQKPMALNLREADSMIAAAERSGKKLMVSFFEIFHPAFRKAKEIIDAGLIGDVFHLKGDMSWYCPTTDIWRFDPAVSGGGILMDGHSHHAALFRWLTDGDEPRSVCCQLGMLNSDTLCEDIGITLLRTKTRLIEISGSSRIKEPSSQNGAHYREVVDIFGSEGTIQVRPLERPSLRLYTEHPDVDERFRAGWFAPKLEWVPYDERGYSSHFNGDEDPWVEEHRHFLDCIANNSKPVTDGLFGRKVLEVIQAGYRSAKEERLIVLPIDS